MPIASESEESLRHRLRQLSGYIKLSESLWSFFDHAVQRRVDPILQSAITLEQSLLKLHGSKQLISHYAILSPDAISALLARVSSEWDKVTAMLVKHKEDFQSLKSARKGKCRYFWRSYFKRVVTALQWQCKGSGWGVVRAWDSISQDLHSKIAARSKQQLDEILFPLITSDSAASSSLAPAACASASSSLPPVNVMSSIQRLQFSLFLPLWSKCMMPFVTVMIHIFHKFCTMVQTQFLPWILSSIHLQAVSLPANWRTKLSLAWKPLGLNVSSLFSLVSFVRDVVTCFDASHMSALDVVVSGSLSWLVQLGFNSALLSNPLWVLFLVMLGVESVKGIIRVVKGRSRSLVFDHFDRLLQGLSEDSDSN